MKKNIIRIVIVMLGIAAIQESMPFIINAIQSITAFVQRNNVDLGATLGGLAILALFVLMVVDTNKIPDGQVHHELS